MQLVLNTYIFYFNQYLLFLFKLYSGVEITASYLCWKSSVLDGVCWIYEQIEEFALRFTEEGTTVREEIDVDVEGKTEVIHVPAHNNKAPMDVMNDFISVSNIMCVNESYELVNILACKKTLQWIYFP